MIPITLMTSCVITFSHSLGGPAGDALKNTVNEYNSEHPQSLVELQYINPSDYASSAKEALHLLSNPAADHSAAPNIVLAPEYMTGDMLQALEQGHVISVSEVLDSETLSDIAELVKGTFGPHCLPYNPACGVLYVNTTLLEEIGVSPNWKPDSLEELSIMSRRLIDLGKIEHGYTCAWPEAYLVEAVLAQQNKALFNEEGHYNFSQMADHIFEMRELVKQKVFLPPNTGNYDPTRQFFIDRKVAFYMQGSGHSTLIENEASKANFNVGYAPLPNLSMGQQEKYAFPLGGAALWVLNKNSKNLPQETAKAMIEGVRDFTNYLASKKVQKKRHEETACVPIRKDLIEDEDMKNFHAAHPLHAAVLQQTIGAKVGKNSFGIKKVGYADVRKKLYPLIRELITLSGDDEAARETIENALKAFDKQYNALD